MGLKPPESVGVPLFYTSLDAPEWTIPSSLRCDMASQSSRVGNPAIRNRPRDSSGRRVRTSSKEFNLLVISILAERGRSWTANCEGCAGMLKECSMLECSISVGLFPCNRHLSRVASQQVERQPCGRSSLSHPRIVPIWTTNNRRKEWRGRP